MPALSPSRQREASSVAPPGRHRPRRSQKYNAHPLRPFSGSILSSAGDSGGGALSRLPPAALAGNPSGCFLFCTAFRRTLTDAQKTSTHRIPNEKRMPTASQRSSRGLSLGDTPGLRHPLIIDPERVAERSGHFAKTPYDASARRALSTSQPICAVSASRSGKVFSGRRKR